MPPHKGIRRNKHIEFQQGFAPNCLRFPRQRPLSIVEPNTLATQTLLRQAILSFEEFNDDQLAQVNPARDNHPQECEQRRHGTHAKSLPQTSFGLLNTSPSRERPISTVNGGCRFFLKADARIVYLRQALRQAKPLSSY